ncbi:MAG: ATP-binding protein [Sulfuricellaceae bacterium]|nr:ATP-binding protein [Sulfuricellaceae bacterium]
MSDLALDTELDQEQQEYLAIIKQSSHDLLDILNNILDFSSIESGDMALTQSDFLFSDRMSQTQEQARSQATKKGLSFETRLDPNIPPILMGDSKRLGQILDNLLDNAIKFTQAGGIHLQATLLEKSSQVAMLRFDIKDSGIGMSEDQLQRLFRAFSQGDSSSTRQYGGTGIGLALTKRLVELMGGEIRVESQPAHGSTFTVLLPFGVSE